MVTTVRPKARATPRNPMPTFGTPEARTAAPHPPKTSTNVPRNSAATRCVRECSSPMSRHCGNLAGPCSPAAGDYALSLPSAPPFGVVCVALERVREPRVDDLGAQHDILQRVPLGADGTPQQPERERRVQHGTHEGPDRAEPGSLTTHHGDPHDVIAVRASGRTPQDAEVQHEHHEERGHTA